MNYGISIIALAILDILVIFSGLPTGWKRGLVLIVSLCIAFIGWIISAVEKRRRLRAKERAASMEETFAADFEQAAKKIERDLRDKVEYDISRMDEQKPAPESDEVA